MMFFLCRLKKIDGHQNCKITKETSCLFKKKTFIHLSLSIYPELITLKPHVYRCYITCKYVNNLIFVCFCLATILKSLNSKLLHMWFVFLSTRNFKNMKLIVQVHVWIHVYFYIPYRSSALFTLVHNLTEFLKSHKLEQQDKIKFSYSLCQDLEIQCNLL